MSKLIYYAKTALKTVTTPKMRDGIKKVMFNAYSGIHFSKHRTIDKTIPFGVNLLGHIRGDFGLGESCRLVAEALRQSGIPFSVRNVPLDGPAEETDTSFESAENNELPYCVNLIHINPDKISGLIWMLNPKKLSSRYNIAFWLWELPEFPQEWLYTIKLFDEIWTPASFITETLRKYTDKPVYTVPYGLRLPRTNERFERAYFGLPEDVFLFLISYDGNSVSARKNPEGAIRAYASAVSPEDKGVGLVIKATHESAGNLGQMREMLRDYPNIIVLEDSYSKEEFNSLVKCVDAYVSLHRAEGFGLVMAEAMLLGTPVIATNWSANTEFMDQNTACMVDAEVVELEQDYPPYHAGDHWAQPDEKQASQWMRRLYEDAAFREKLATAAKARLEKDFTPKRSGQLMKERLLELK